MFIDRIAFAVLSSKPCRMVPRLQPSLPASRLKRAAFIWAGAFLVATCIFFASSDVLTHAAKGKSKRPARPPDLKIVSVNMEPAPFVLSASTLTLTIMVELPKVIPENALLDVTTFISSPSKYSFRLLNSRQALPVKENPSGASEDNVARRMEIVQTWDGTDHNKRIVAAGMYAYEVKAKLMVMTNNTPLTRVTAWAKRGSLEVRAP